MKKLSYIFLAVGIMLSFMSCELETSDNGNLDGFWHLVSIDTLSTSGNNDLSQQLIFWSFQHHLMTLNDKNGTNKVLVSRFQRTDNTIKIYDTCIDDRMKGDIPLTDEKYLKPYGVNMLEDFFLVEKLSNKSMTLKSQTLRLRFIKM